MIRYQLNFKMRKINRFFFAFFSFKNRTVAMAVSIILALTNQKVIQFNYE